jgi:hypothetical protein
MKFRCLGRVVGRLFICLVGSLALVGLCVPVCGQQSPQSQTQTPEERPTLGPRTGPAPLDSGPMTASVIDVRKLLRIHTLYVENIDNSLSDKLVAALGKLGRFHLVSKEKEADAVVRGSCLESRRLKRVHSEVFISDHNGASIWQDTIYRPYNPPALDQAISDTAELIVDHLERTVREAQQH